MTLVGRFEALAALVALALAAAISAMTLFGEPRPLAVIAATPADGAAGVPVGTQVTVIFSRPVDESSVRTALSVEPQTDGFVSTVGRRAAFTPKAGFRGDTDYTLRLGTGIRDRAGGSLPRPVAIRFRTRGQSLVVRTGDGQLLRTTLAGAAEALAGPGVGEFAVSSAGDVAFVEPVNAVLVVQPGRRGPARRIALPRRVARFQGYGPGPAVEVRLLTWAPGGAAIGFLGATGDGASVPYLVRLDEATPAPTPFGPAPDLIPSGSSPLAGALKRSLAEIVYGRDTFAFTPDRRGAIVRDRNWDFVVLGFDGQQRGTFGPFLAVGNLSPRGERVAFVDADPADPARRHVVAYERAGRLRSLSSPDRDSHSPRFAHSSERVVFTAGSGLPLEGRYAIEIVDLGSGAQGRLTAPPPGESDEDPQWSLDDAWISFRRAPAGAPERGVVWLVPADGGAAHPLPIVATDARWSP